MEVATLTLADGITREDFASVDTTVANEHVSRQSIFISRKSVANGDDEWLIIVPWRPMEAAEASMARFNSVPAAQNFISMLDASSMTMTRYRSVHAIQKGATVLFQVTFFLCFN